MSNKSDRDRLLEGLQQDGESFFGSGVWNNVTDIVLTLSIVLASVLAACLAVSNMQHHRWVIAFVAAIPAAATSIQTKVGVRERSDWYFLYAAEVRALATELEFAESPNVEDFAKRRAKLETVMETEWHKLARHSSSRRSRSGKVNGDY
jgi:hypothetical protein